MIKVNEMSNLNRRTFLTRCLQGGVTMAGLTNLQLNALNNVVSQQSFGDYKALVCVFLMGGNDSLNMLVPLSGENRQHYLNSRQNLAIENPLAIQPLTSQDGGVGLHTGLASLSTIFSERRLAFVSNVGSLIEPINKSEYKAKARLIPKQLFSHNDQQATWMRGREGSTIRKGWGGRLLEILEANNQFSSNISLAGTNLWQTSAAANPFSLNKNGVAELVPVRGTSKQSQIMNNALKQLYSQGSHPLSDSYSQLTDRAWRNSEQIRLALNQAPTLQTVFSNTSLSNQLKAVAKMISTNQTLDVKRQIYFVSMGGFDTHDNQIIAHEALLQQLANGLKEFDQAMTEMSMQEKVTTFTMSDFGRTLTSNGDGTDHGWAGHQIIMGGGIKGGDIYGALPSQRLDSEQDVGGGRIIPSTANEQYFNTLAQWFGMSSNYSADLFPNLQYFNQKELSFFV
jgi:uncharacterized protein (DUF1501 family)